MNGFDLIGGLLWLPVALTGAYLLVFALAGKLLSRHRLKSEVGEATHRRIAVLVPAYREDAVILDTAQRLLQIDYPQDCWDLVIIGDHLQADTVARLRAMPLRFIELTLTESTKAKALNAALQQLGAGYDVALVLDADNVVDLQVLHDFDRAFRAGKRVVQARRVAKNQNSAVAILDAISEEVNNTIFCQGHRSLGLSSRLIGSGMAFDYALFKQFMAENHAVGGFDKELELTLMHEGEIVEYLPDTWIYDEKVSQGAHFGRQRLRWIAAQYHYLGRFFSPALSCLLRGERLSFVDKTLQMLLLPRLVLIGTATLGSLLAWLLGSSPLAWAWTGAFLAVAAAYAIATPGRFYRLETFKALMQLPAVSFRLVWELRGIRQANKKFIHTPHSVNNDH